MMIGLERGIPKGLVVHKPGYTSFHPESTDFRKGEKELNQKYKTTIQC